MLSYERRHLVDILWFHKRPSGGGAFVAVESFLELEDSTSGTPSYMDLESDPGTDTDRLKLEDSV